MEALILESKAKYSECLQEHEVCSQWLVPDESIGDPVISKAVFLHLTEEVVRAEAAHNTSYYSIQLVSTIH